MNKIATLIDRGLELRGQIDTLEAELKNIEVEVIGIAQQGEQVPLLDQEREGKQFLARGSALVVPVVFTADKIIGSFKDGSATHNKIVLAAGKHLSSFYKAQTTWEALSKGGKQFRRLVAELLGKDGPALVTACLARDKYGIPKSDIKIEWEGAKEIEG